MVGVVSFYIQPTSVLYPCPMLLPLVKDFALGFIASFYERYYSIKSLIKDELDAFITGRGRFMTTRRETEGIVRLWSRPIRTIFHCLLIIIRREDKTSVVGSIKSLSVTSIEIIYLQLEWFRVKTFLFTINFSKWQSRLVLSIQLGSKFKKHLNCDNIKGTWWELCKNTQTALQ